MLKRQSELPLSPYGALYEILIPKDHELRRLLELVDFSFIYDELSTKYSIDEGRSAVDPVQMFKYLFLKVFYNLSDRSLINRAKTDLALKFFLGLNPEDQVIHASLLTKFRRQRLQDMDLLHQLLKKTIQIAVEHDILTSKSVIVDATHTVSRFNQKSPIETLRLTSKALRKQLYKIDPDIKSQLPFKNTINDLAVEHVYTQQLIDTVNRHPEMKPYPAVKEALENLKEIQADIKDYEKYSKDKDAKVGHKTKDSSFFGYKTHLAMSEERIVTAAVITSGEKGDGQYLSQLIEQSKENGMVVKKVTGDRAYSGKENLEYAKKHQIELYSRLNPIIANGKHGTGQTWDFNKDAGMFLCPGGHLAIRKARQGKKNVSKNQVFTYYFDVEKCQHCPFRDGCYKPGAKTKTYSVSIKSDLHQKQMEFEQTNEFRKQVTQRYKIEAKNAELKQRHGYNHSWSNNIKSMTLQGAITLFCANIKRIDKLVSEKEVK